MVSQAVALLNTRFGDRYLFGGNKDNVPPFDGAGNYLGDTGVRQVEIAPGELEDASVRADVIAKGVGGGVDVLGALQTFSTALGANDITTIQGTITELSNAIGQVSAGRTKLGSAMNLFDTAAETSRISVVAEQKSTSQLVEVDAIEAASRLALAQRALDAALTASARSFDLTLLNKLT
jgi:flagellar hook-associated protein 3 FlgL